MSDSDKFHLLGTDLFGGEIKADVSGKIRERFDFPPFTVLNAREGLWQDRKRAWLSLGIQSEVGRGESLLKLSDTILERDPEKRAAMQAAHANAGLTWNVTDMDQMRHREELQEQQEQDNHPSDEGWVKTGLTFASGTPRRDPVSLKLQGFTEEQVQEIKRLQAKSKSFNINEWVRQKKAEGELTSGLSAGASGTSIFDPVLTELCYKWFCPPGGLILDPFAGGSVRGVVAGLLGYRYHGIDLRPEQIAANEAQREQIAPHADITWHVGDSNVLLDSAPDADFVFSCHPSYTRVTTKEFGPKLISEIKVGDFVRTHTGSYQPVTECLTRKYTGKIFNFVRDFRRNILLVATEEHPFLIKRVTALKRDLCACGCGESVVGSYKRGHNNKHHNGLWGENKSLGPDNWLAKKYARVEEKISWLRASEIQVNDFLLEPVPSVLKTPVDGQVIWRFNQPHYYRGRPSVGDPNVKATREICRLLGYYLSEGSASGGGVSFAFNENEIDYHNDVVNLWSSQFETKATPRHADGDLHTVTIVCSGTIAAQFFQTVGVGAANKCFPDWVWECSNELLAEVIKGVWRGDGWVSKDRFGYASVSEKLVEDLRRALLRFGIIASVRCRAPRPTNYCVDPLPQWNLVIRGESAEKMSTLLEVALPIIPAQNRRPRRAPFIKDGFVHYRIREIEQETVVDLPVFNLEVAEDHSFIAEGIVSHNCPPYGDLEQYSDNPDDLSTMTWNGFVGIYRSIIRKAVERLKPNRFACFVVGEYRDTKTGLYRGFVPLTCASFMAAGAALYNEAVLITAIGSLPIRVTKQFETTRKLGKTHQNVLIFCKGDPRIAAAAVENGTTQDEPRRTQVSVPEMPQETQPTFRPKMPVRMPSPGLSQADGLPFPTADSPQPAIPSPAPASLQAGRPAPQIPASSAASPDAPAGARAIGFAMEAKPAPAASLPAHPLSVSSSSARGSLAEFLNDTRVDSAPSWTPQEPPILDGIDNIILNFATDGLDWDKGARPVGVTVGTLDGQMTRFLPFAFKGGGNLDPDVVKRWLQEQVKNKHITNSKTKFDIHQSREFGVDLIEQGNTFSDIQHTAALLDDSRKRFALDVLAADYLPGIREVPRVDETRHASYAAHEVVAREIYTAQTVGRLRAKFYPMLDEQELRGIQQIEDDVIPAVVEMEKNGSLLDMELVEQYHRECVSEHSRLMREIADECGFGFDGTNPGWQRLFEKCGLTPSDSYAENVVGVIDHPLIKKAHYAGQVASLDSKTFAAYKKQVDSEGILRYDINQLLSDEGGTVSGRFSIGYVQQVPNQDNHFAAFGDKWFPRRVFKSKTPWYLEADASQIEYRLFAHYASNPAVLKAYEDDPAMSFHKMTWEMVKAYKPDMLYSHQKNLNFAKLYGAKVVKLGVMMGFITQAEADAIRRDKDWNNPKLALAQEIDRMYNRAMPEVNLLLDRASHLAKPKCDDFCKAGDQLHRDFPHRGYVKTLEGRRSRFPTGYKTYIALNRVLQGTAADIMKRKLAELFKHRKRLGLLLRVTVHDAVGGDAASPETLELVKEQLNHQSVVTKVPILWSCGIGKNWAEAK